MVTSGMVAGPASLICTLDLNLHVSSVLVQKLFHGKRIMKT